MLLGWRKKKMVQFGDELVDNCRINIQFTVFCKVVFNKVKKLKFVECCQKLSLVLCQFSRRTKLSDNSTTFLAFFSKCCFYDFVKKVYKIRKCFNILSKDKEQKYFHM